MRYNPDKCHVLRLSRKKEPTKHQYTLKGHVLDTPDSSMDLGDDINSKLTWDQHIKRNSPRANRTLGFVTRNFADRIQSNKRSSI